MSFPFEPRDHAEEVAHFRLAVIGELTSRDLAHGELAEELRRLASQRYRPPGAESTRTFGASTLERWFYAYKSDGVTGLAPGPRRDRGPGRDLTPELRELLLGCRKGRSTQLLEQLERGVDARRHLARQAELCVALVAE